MKKIIIYSSKTGNTKMVAQAIADELSCDALSYENAPNLNDFDLIILGYYIDKGGADSGFYKFVKEQIINKKVGYFITMGAEPEGEILEKTMQNAREFLKENEILREFVCQGKINPQIIEQMKQIAQKMGDKAMHQITPERIARWEAAKTHPDKTDLLNAKNAFSGL
ncbi:flavodoxin family protein [Campylobacter mucosalis]|uniref:flavodoxin family protein n=1 Tax=Campylobacter mucosalis TaxID=202 RepID=UPI00147075DA|nr:flavodoxin family protein [Campylobacter mucosalis]